MDDIAGKVIGVILVFLMLGITPLYFTSIIESARDQLCKICTECRQRNNSIAGLRRRRHYESVYWL